jgi:hypothetical protein
MEPVEDLKVGDRDSYGRELLKVHAKELNRYTIYETITHELVVQGPESHKCNQPAIHEAMQAVSDLTIQHPSLKEKYNGRIAYAYKLAIDGDGESGENALRAVAEDMGGLLHRQATMAYQWGALIATVIPAAVFAIAHLVAPLNELAIRLLTAGVFGAIGGLFSVILGSRQLSVDGKDSFQANLTYGAFRIIIAAISAVIVVFLIGADLLLGPLKKSENFDGFVIACVVAGFSERFVPNMLRGLDGSNKAKR